MDSPMRNSRPSPIFIIFFFIGFSMLLFSRPAYAGPETNLRLLYMIMIGLYYASRRRFAMSNPAAPAMITTPPIVNK